MVHQLESVHQAGKWCVRGLSALVSLEASENDLASARRSVETLLFEACPSVERRVGIFVGHVGTFEHFLQSGHNHFVES